MRISSFSRYNTLEQNPLKDKIGGNFNPKTASGSCTNHFTDRSTVVKHAVKAYEQLNFE